MLVEPLIPSQFLSLLCLNCENFALRAQANRLLSFAEDLLYDLRVDRRSELLVFSAELAVLAQDAEASKMLFAAYLVESLWHLRMHDAERARSAWESATLYSKGGNCSGLSKTAILESLGLVKALIDELDERLACYKRCI